MSAHLALINNSTSRPYSAILANAICLDFPIFETRCELSPHTICNHSHQQCKKAQLSLIGYAKFESKEAIPNHDFYPHTATPIPQEDFLCQGCGTNRTHCKEQCQSFLPEVVGYLVEEWDSTERKFVEKEVTVGGYAPLKHGFFSYQLWKEERNRIRQRRAQAKLGREKKRKTRETDDEEAQPKSKKSRTNHSDNSTA